MKIRISSDAQTDLINIAAYSETQWGKTKRIAYIGRLLDAMESLSEYPHIGKSRIEIKEHLYSLPVEKHVIYYMIDGDTLHIINILHETMEPSHHLH